MTPEAVTIRVHRQFVYAGQTWRKPTTLEVPVRVAQFLQAERKAELIQNARVIKP